GPAPEASSRTSPASGEATREKSRSRATRAGRSARPQGDRGWGPAPEASSRTSPAGGARRPSEDRNRRAATVTPWRARGKICRRGSGERVRTRFFLAIALTRPYSDFDFDRGKLFAA